jgi:hypothetical protein
MRGGEVPGPAMGNVIFVVALYVLLLVPVRYWLSRDELIILIIRFGAVTCRVLAVSGCAVIGDLEVVVWPATTVVVTGAACGNGWPFGERGTSR